MTHLSAKLLKYVFFHKPRKLAAGRALESVEGFCECCFRYLVTNVLATSNEILGSFICFNLFPILVVGTYDKTRCWLFLPAEGGSLFVFNGFEQGRLWQLSWMVE